MNRQQRRAVKAVAEGAAEELSRLAYDYTPQGQLVRVTHPKAVAALKRAFLLMIDNGCKPQVTRIAPDTAEAFPRATRPPEGVSCYLAVGLDPDARGTYSLRNITTPDAPPEVEEQLNRRAALAHLQPLIARRGFPQATGSGAMQ